jgi:hypothetical protein
VPGAARHDDKLAWSGRGIAVSRLDGQLSTADQDELAGAGRLLPGDLAVDLTMGHRSR